MSVSRPVPGRPSIDGSTPAEVRRPDSGKIRTRLQRHSVYVRAPAEIDLATLDQLRAPLERIGPNEEVIVDLRCLDFCGSAGLALLLEADRRARSLGSSLTLSHPPPHFDRLLTITGLSEVFTIRRTPAARRRRLGGTDADRR